MSSVLDFLGSVVYYGWIAVLAVTGIQHLRTNREWFAYYRRINFKLYAYILPTILLILLTAGGLISLNPDIFGASWIKSMGNALGKSGGGTNINLAGTNIPVLGIFMCLLFMTQLPVLARIEENLFRKGTKGWQDGVTRSICFGLVHLLVGVPFGAALALIWAGLLFTFMYFKGGIRLSTQTHFQYNLVLLLFLLFVAVLITIVALSK